VPKKINGVTIVIMIVVASFSLLSTTILTSPFKQGTGVLLKANGLPLDIEENALDFPITADSILNKISNKEEISEFSSETPLPPFPSIENEGLDTDKTPLNLNEPSAEIITGKGDEIPNQYIVVLKNKLPTTPSEEASEARKSGAAVLNVYENVLKGFSIRVPNERVLEAIQRNPNIAYIEQDMQVQAQLLPRGVNRVDGELSSTISGNGAGSVNADIAILDTGIQLSHTDLNVYRQKTFVSGTSSANMMMKKTLYAGLTNISITALAHDANRWSKQSNNTVITISI
jgi:hypothetical protein